MAFQLELHVKEIKQCFIKDHINEADYFFNWEWI